MVRVIVVPVRIMIPGVPIPAAVVPGRIIAVMPRTVVPAVPIPRVHGPGVVAPGTVIAIVPGTSPIPVVTRIPAAVRGVSHPDVQSGILCQRDGGRVGGMVETKRRRHVFGNEEGIGGLAVRQIDLRTFGFADECGDVLVQCGRACGGGCRFIVDTVLELRTRGRILCRRTAGGQGKQCGKQSEKSCFHTCISYIIKNIVSLYARFLAGNGFGIGYCNFRTCPGTGCKIGK